MKFTKNEKLAILEAIRNDNNAYTFAHGQAFENAVNKLVKRGIAFMHECNDYTFGIVNLSNFSWDKKAKGNIAGGFTGDIVCS